MSTTRSSAGPTRRRRIRARQRGAALLIALILLAAVTFLSLSAFKASTTSLQAVASTEARMQAQAAAQAAIDRTLRNALFTSHPKEVAAAPVDIDIDGDAVVDYQPVLQPPPTCTRVAALHVADLDPDDPADLACLGSGVAHTSGIEGGVRASQPGASHCANSEWLIRARTQDPRTGASVAVNQGVAVRILEADSANHCGQKRD